jgi:hypothetical protein
MNVPADGTGDTLDPAVADYLLGMLEGSLPPIDDAEKAQARRAAMRAAFLAMRPRNPTEGMLAAETIAAHHAIMNCYRVALQTETDPAEAARARSSAATLSRVRLATLRVLQGPPAPPPARSPARPPRRAEAPAPAEPAPPPIPTQERAYVPRDRFGEPIPVWRWSDITMAQRRAAFADPAQDDVREAALAEEAVMIAARVAADANPAAAPNAEVMPPPEARC